MVCWAVRCTPRGASPKLNLTSARVHNIQVVLIKGTLLWYWEQYNKRPRAITVANQGTIKESAINFKMISLLGELHVVVVHVEGVVMVRVEPNQTTLLVEQVATGAATMVAIVVGDTNCSTTLVNNQMSMRSCALVSLHLTINSSNSPCSRQIVPKIATQ